MTIRVLILDDRPESYWVAIADALRPFCQTSAQAVQKAIDEEQALILEGFGPDPIGLILMANVSRDVEAVVREVEQWDREPPDLVLVDDDWGESSSEFTAGQDLLLPAAFRLDGRDDSLPILALFTRHWPDETERVDRFAELLRKEPYWGSNRVTGLYKEDVGGLRLLLQRVIGECQSVEAKNQAEDRAELSESLLSLMGGPTVDNLPEQPPSPKFDGSSIAMREMYWWMNRWAKVPYRFHIFGEAGTGKTVAARIIHDRSPLVEGPFVRVNMNAPDTLIDSELFGIEGDVSTGVAARAGQIESAHGGTLFLDNVDLVPSVIQEKLLHFLEEGEVQRIGSTKPKRFKVRVVSASNRDLRCLVDEGEFREDLFYRLRCDNVLRVPSLRDRREDTPRIAQRYLKADLKRPGLELREDALLEIQAHDWRENNVRELQSFLERLATVVEGDGEIGAETVRAVLEFPGGDRSAAEELSPVPGPPLSSSSYDPLGDAKLKLGIVNRMLLEGKGPGDIGRVIHPKSGNGRQMLRNFLMTNEAMEVFSDLGDEGVRRYYGAVLDKLVTKWKGTLRNGKTGRSYPDWVLELADNT